MYAGECSKGRTDVKGGWREDVCDVVERLWARSVFKDSGQARLDRELGSNGTRTRRRGLVYIYLLPHGEWLPSQF